MKVNSETKQKRNIIPVLLGICLLFIQGTISAQKPIENKSRVAASLATSKQPTAGIPKSPSCWGANLAKREHAWFIEFVEGERGFFTRTAKGLHIQGPWYVDTNHQEDGEIVVLAVYRNPSQLHSNPANGCCDLDLRDATADIKFTLNAPPGSHMESGTAGAKVLFWFQTAFQEEMPGYGPRTFNYVLVSQPLFRFPSGPPGTGHGRTKEHTSG